MRNLFVKGQSRKILFDKNFFFITLILEDLFEIKVEKRKV